MRVRLTKPNELDEVMKIYAHAREFMAAHGNPRQWGATNWPPRDLIARDIQASKSRVCMTESHRIAAVFFYDFGKDVEPCYEVIRDGAWLDGGPYGVVHRIASAGIVHGAGTACLNWAFEQSGHVRIDTHPDNVVFQRLLRKLGFCQCGIIHVEEDDDPRLAFEKIS